MNLTLSEQLLLLSHDDVSGKPLLPAGQLDYALAGARLLELSYAGQLEIDHGKVIVTGKPGDDPVPVRIAATKPHSAAYWVFHLANADRRQDLLDGLVAKGVLRRDEHRVLGLFKKVRAFPEIDAAPERELVDHLRDVLKGAVPPDERSVGLLALIHGTDLDRKLFPDAEPATLRHRMSELTEGDWCGKAVGKTIGALNAAVIAAVSGGVVSTAPAVAGT